MDTHVMGNYTAPSFGPSPTFGVERHCGAGPECVGFAAGLMSPTILSMYNPGPYCYCCQRKRGKPVAPAPDPRGYSPKEIEQMMRTVRSPLAIAKVAA